MRRWAAVCFVLSGLVLVVGWVTRDGDERLDGAPTTTATVVGVAGSSLDLDLTLPGGEVVRASTTEFRDVPAKGAQLQVQYAVDGKDLVVREAGLKSGQDAWGSLIAAGASALIGFVLLVLRTRGEQPSDVGKKRG
ncbi:hypothetical protein GCM10029976_057110 [Kribbella albertanoniae]|uniref:Uncharacterized protein n=1 Tax=Kribbella albertanoniae TaxID=1266829 RepID=A0A4V2XME6_9ACTN|nr:hypothetical protein [Kribbella albertanoniae]TDC13996.1 hypothetical protein E1261_44410 [Kribbella albertanoniae]